MLFIWLHIHYLVWSSGQLCKGQFKNEARSDARRGHVTAGIQESDTIEFKPTSEEAYSPCSSFVIFHLASETSSGSSSLPWELNRSRTQVQHRTSPRPRAEPEELTFEGERGVRKGDLSDQGASRIVTNREEMRLGYQLFPRDMGPQVRSALVTGREQVGSSHRKVMCLI